MIYVDWIARWCVILGGCTALVVGLVAGIVFAINKLCRDAAFIQEFVVFTLARRRAKEQKK